ncbi:hypothetical protein LJK88_09075 [Paenibacillus sp. P26]|nr:hypothetical protein LJK88_09075 [Paenibacillus sp. P26]
MKKHVWMKSLAWLLLAGYGSCVLYWMFVGFRRSTLTAVELRYNVIPLKTILHFMTTAGSHNWMFPIINLAGISGCLCLLACCCPSCLRGPGAMRDLP